MHVSFCALRELSWRGLALAADAREVKWNGKDTFREYRVPGTDWVLMVRIFGNRPELVKVANGIIDKELTAFLRQVREGGGTGAGAMGAGGGGAAGSATMPAAGGGGAGTRGASEPIYVPSAGQRGLCGEVALTLGWNGQVVGVPGPLVWPAEGRKTAEYLDWQRRHDMRTLRFTDAAGRKWEAQTLTKDVMSEITVRGADGTLLATGAVLGEAGPSHWEFYDGKGEREVFKVICAGDDGDGGLHGAVEHCRGDGAGGGWDNAEVGGESGGGGARGAGDAGGRAGVLRVLCAALCG